jgi:hypothetical protein
MTNVQAEAIIRDLGDGLILRHGTPEDAAALGAFNAGIHGNRETRQPDERVGIWTQDLAACPHPTFVAGDFTVVEDTRRGAIVSTLCLIPQTWSYAGIPFGVGRPELVGTHEEYRRHGLVRAQFDTIHRWSAERGHMLQGITGIPYYYRQYGYEMALALGGGRVGHKSQTPKLKEGQAEPYRLRPATLSDLPFISQIYEHASRRDLVACVHDAGIWQYDLVGRSPRNVNRRELRVIESAEGESVGYVTLAPWLEHGTLGINACEVKAQVSWLAVAPSVLRAVQAVGEGYAAQDPKQEFQWLGLWLGAEHPLYEVVEPWLTQTRPPYAWYIRVPDLPAFLRHIAPALERRLAESVAVGFSGELVLRFYRSAVRLVLERGRIAAVEPWRDLGHDTPPGAHVAAFPDHTFLKLLFGYRTLDELRAAFPDCSTRSHEARLLVNILFPKKASNIWPVD